MNAILVKQTLEKVVNPNVLVNLISRRVRQLTTYGGAAARPLVANVGSLGAADIALREILEGKMDFEEAEPTPVTRPTDKGRSRPKHWGRT
jgi:DNA-directed RNA polymerase subunit omega